MTFKEELQEAIDAGHRQKLEDDHIVALEQAAAAQRRLADLARLREKAMEMLRPLPNAMQAAARRGSCTCIAWNIPVQDINFPIAFEDGCPLRSTRLIGLSACIFAVLQELQLTPEVNVRGPSDYYIVVWVPPSVTPPPLPPATPPPLPA